MLGLSACTEVNRFLARAEGKPPQGGDPSPQVAEQAAPEPIPSPQEKAKSGKLYEWNGDGRRVSRIVVNTDEQKARFYDGDEQIGWTTVASGVSKFPTPTGHFEVVEKVANKRSNLYGKIYGAGGKVVRSDAKAGRDPIPAGARFEGAKMPYFLRLTNDGIGLHAGPIPRPGRPASHGCIRMPSKLAPVLFEHVDLGVKVSIVGSGPDYGNYVQKQRAIAAREKERREAAARQQAVAAAAAPTATPAQSSPSAIPIAGMGAGTTGQSAEHAGAAADRGVSSPNEAPQAQPSVAGPPAAESRAAHLAGDGAVNPPPQAASPSDSESVGTAPAPEAAAPVAQIPSPQPSYPVTPAAVPPMPAYPASLSPLARPPHYAPPMRPAAAAIPAPIGAPPAPAPLAATPQAPSPPPNAPATPIATPAPNPDPPAVSAEQPKAAAEANDG